MVVVGVVEADAVGASGARAEDGVVEDGSPCCRRRCFRRWPHEIARDFEVAVDAAGCLEAAVGVGERVGEAVGAGLAGRLSFGPQPPVAKLCSETKLEAVACGFEMLLAAVDEVGLHGGGERVDVAVGVLSGEDVLAVGERIEVGVVLKEAAGRADGSAGLLRVCRRDRSSRGGCRTRPRCRRCWGVGARPSLRG